MHRFPAREAIILIAAFGLVVRAMTAEAPTPLPTVTVISTGVPGENKMVGDYGQPEWSARRPFPGVSVYVQPGAQIELETGLEDATTSTGANHREWTQELEAGLGHRLQLAVENTVANFREGADAPLEWREDSLKLSTRYALANWGKLPLNPALGVGWRFNSGAADAPSCQLVLGDELTPRLHWAADFQYEWQTSAPHREELAAAAALTYSVTNETLNVGVQAQWKRTREHSDPRSDRTEAGPCIQYRPIDQLHLDGVVLWGSEGGRSVHTVVLSIGFEFGPGADDHDDDRERGGRLAH
jgi:hypothetical protein